MSYSDFTLEKVQADFSLILEEKRHLFTAVDPVPPSELLQMTLEEYLPLAIDINSEKARSEFIIAPILGDIRRQTHYQVSLFSGKEFNVGKTKGLNGLCDFILSRSTEQLYIRTPVVTIVEAKNENLIGGIGQCIAAMVGAQIFNQQSQNSVKKIYGAVTTGTNWRFLFLQDKTIYLDATEYYIREVERILGILLQPIRSLVAKDIKAF